MCNSSCGYSIASFLYVFERLASCCAMTAVVSCLIATLMIMLGMGIGVGYNYCFVETKAAAMHPILGDLPEGPHHHQTDTDTVVKVTGTGEKDASTGENDAATNDGSRKRFQRIVASNRTFTTTRSTTEGDKSLIRILGGHSFRNTGNNAKRYAIHSQTHLESNTNSEYSGSTETATSSTALSASVSDNIKMKPTIVVPLQSVDLLSFIKKLRESNKNVTLELIQ